MKHILQDLKELKTGRRELRNFGLLVGAVFVVIAIVFVLLGKHKALVPWFLPIGIALGFFGLVAPTLLKPVYIVWMAVAMAMGFVVSNVLLILLFFLAITPVGLAARLAGKDFLGLKLNRQAASYWARRESTAKKPEDYERQF